MSINLKYLQKMGQGTFCFLTKGLFHRQLNKGKFKRLVRYKYHYLSLSEIVTAHILLSSFIECMASPLKKRQ